jgi:hypothetical protein
MLQPRTRSSNASSPVSRTPQVCSQPSGEKPGEGGQDRPVAPVRLRLGNLPTQHSEFVTQDEDLDVLGMIPAAKEHQPAEHPRHDQVEKAKRHSR